MDGSFHGKSQSKMDDDWGYPIYDIYGNPQMENCMTAWWLSHPSEKYESQLGWLETQSMEKYEMFQTTNPMICRGNQYRGIQVTRTQRFCLVAINHL